jgi:dCTP deaminase
MLMGDAVLPYQDIQELIRSGEFLVPNEKPVQIQPCSSDLTLNSHVYNVRTSALPSNHETVESIAQRYKRYDFDLREDRDNILIPGQTNILEYQESVNMTKGRWADMNPKSSSGRGGLLTFVQADGISHYDRVNKPGSRKLYVECTPLKWHTRVDVGTAISQVRFIDGDPRMDAKMIRYEHRKSPLLFDREGNPFSEEELPIMNDGIILSADLESEIVAYRAKNNSQLTYLLSGGRGSMVNLGDLFWEKIYRPHDGELTLEPDFYLMATYERVAFSEMQCGVLDAYDTTAMEGRSHIAGFFDAGFGYRYRQKYNGTPVTLELFLLHKPFRVRHRQPIARMNWLMMRAAPMKDGQLFIYGSEGLQSNYADQPPGPTLAKQFLNPR